MPVSPALQLWFAGRAARFRLGRPRPLGAPRVELLGPDPLRVLVTGAGIAAGYGVRSHDASLAGALARCIARRTGRGVVVDVDAEALLPARAAVKHLGPDGAQAFDVVVFCPCFLEAPVAPASGVRRYGADIQRHLLETGGGSLRVVMLGVPRPSRFSRLDLAAAEAATDANTVMRHLAELDPRVLYVEPPTFESVRSEEPFDEGFYEQAGEGVADALLARLAG